MPMEARLSPGHMRRLALAGQGLLHRFPFGQGSAGTLRAIERLGYVQIDTISVIERTHHHTLRQRVQAYAPTHLDALVATGQVFEYWSHAAAFLPMRDFRFSLPRKMAIAAGERHWFQPDTRMMAYVRDRIRAEGPLMARDFQHAQPAGNWYSWKPAKVALEHLFMQGDLMVRERRGFQKVFDLSERVLPPGLDLRVPDAREMAEHLVTRFLEAHGLGSAPEMGYLRRPDRKSHIPNVLQAWVAEGKLTRLSVPESPEPYYAFSTQLESIPRRGGSPHLRLLSPFDNSLIQRQRVQRLFGFEYQLECYVPAERRRYGYYVLPILWGDRLVGRLDPQADRRHGILHLHGLWLEEALPEDFFAALAQALRDLATPNGCGEIRLAPSIEGTWRMAILNYLSRGE